MLFFITSEGKQVLCLRGDATIRHAHDLLAMLAESLDHGQSIEVQTANVEAVDTCILQLLCALRRSVAELTFAAPSAAFVNAVDRCGLHNELLGRREDL